MAKLASTRVYGNLVVDQNISLSGTINDFTLGDISEINKNDNTAHFLRGDGEWITPTNNYLTTASFNSADGVLTLNRNGLTATTVDLDGRYLTSYTESDTLASVTGRGATTTSAISITNTTDSSSTTTGSLIVSGGVGIAKNLYVGGDVDLGGKLQVTGDATFNGSIVIDENLSVGGWLNVAGDATFGGSIDIAEDVNIGGSLKVEDSIEAGSIESELSSVHDNKIYLRVGAEEALGDNEFAGLVAINADGVNDAALLFDGHGRIRVGDIKAWRESDMTYETSPTNITTLSKFDDTLYFVDSSNPDIIFDETTMLVPLAIGSEIGATVYDYDTDKHYNHYYNIDGFTSYNGSTYLKFLPDSSTGFSYPAGGFSNNEILYDSSTSNFYKFKQLETSSKYGYALKHEEDDPLYLYNGTNLYKYEFESWSLKRESPATSETTLTTITVTQYTATGSSLEVTASISDTSNIHVDDLVYISGANENKLNGKWKITDVTASTSFKFNINIPLDSTITTNLGTAELFETGYVDTTSSLYYSYTADGTQPLTTRLENDLMDDKGITFWNGTSGEKRIETRSSFVYKNGYLGLGTSTPTEKLDVVGNINVTGTITSDSIIQASNFIGDNLELNGRKIISTDTNGDIEIEPNGTGEVSITSDINIANGKKYKINGTALFASDIGATTVGANLFELTNPDAVSFFRANADNTITTLSDSDFRNAIGAGTVTSVGATGSVSGITLTGTVTGSGNLVLGGELSVNMSNLNTTGTASTDKFLRGDGSWSDTLTGDLNISSGSSYKIGSISLNAEHVNATPKFAGITEISSNTSLSTSHVNHILYTTATCTVSVGTGFTDGSQITIINEGTTTTTIDPGTNVNINGATSNITMTEAREILTLIKYKTSSSVEYWFAIGG
jgi:hypothetical protein